MSITRRPGFAVATAAALLLCLAGAVLWGVGGPNAVGPVGGPFRLVDAEDRPVTDGGFRGRYMLVYFGYTACPDVCPTTLHEMSVAMQALGAQARRVQPIFVTLDPARDTPAVLHRYIDAIDPGIVALTGRDDAVAALMRQYRVRRAVHPGSDLLDHSSVLYLMGPDGRFVAPLRADEPGDQMARDIAGHML